MSSLGDFVGLSLIVLAVFLVVGFIGFKIPAPIRPSSGEPTGPVSQVKIPKDFPPAITKWLAASEDCALAPSSLTAWGRGRVSSKFPIFGKIWLPLSWKFYLIPCSSFIVQNRITWFKRRFLRGGEEYRDGAGSFILGSNIMSDVHLSETERTLAWLYSIWLAPGSLLQSEAVNFVERSDGKINLLVHEKDLPVQKFELEFDPQTMTLSTITTTRKGSRSGGDYPYVATLGRPKLMESGYMLPTRYTANWDNDVYLKLELAGVGMNEDVSNAMQMGIKDLPD